MVCVGISVGGESVFVGSSVKPGVGVKRGRRVFVGVAEGKDVSDAVGIRVGELVGISVDVSVGINVGVSEAGGVAEAGGVGVLVSVEIGEAVAVGMEVSVGGVSAGVGATNGGTSSAARYSLIGVTSSGGKLAATSPRNSVEIPFSGKRPKSGPAMITPAVTTIPTTQRNLKRRFLRGNT
jgi:hypothetical protein